MKYSQLIKDLEYWKRILGKEDPEVVVNELPYSYKINLVQPVKGIKNERAIGIIFGLQ
jgi:hypothetical protein